MGSECLLTIACEVEKPIPLRFAPVIKTVLPRMPAANSLATSRLSVLALKSERVVAAMLSDIEVIRLLIRSTWNML